MGNPTDRLPVYTQVGPDPTWDLSEEEFWQLERALGTKGPFPSEARASLLSIGRGYLSERMAELNAGKKSEALKLWADAKAHLELLASFGEGSYLPFDDAGRLVESAIFDGFERVSIQLTERDVEPPTLDPFLSLGDKPVNGLLLRIGPNFMMRFGAAIRSAVAHADAQIDDLGQGFRPGQAAATWFAAMRDWSKEYGYPFAARSGGKEASNFSTFLFSLQRMLPEDLREPQMASPEAVAKRLQRLKRTAAPNT